MSSATTGSASKVELGSVITSGDISSVIFSQGIVLVRESWSRFGGLLGSVVEISL